MLGLSVLGLAVFLAGCGGSSSPSTAPPVQTAPPQQTTTPAPPIKLVTVIAATVKPGANAKAYARRVDALVTDSKSNLQDLQLYVSQVLNDTLPPDESLDVARSVLENERTDLTAARALVLPPAFKHSQLLLERSLQLRVDQLEETLVAAKKRYNNPIVGWGGSFQQALAIGQRARSVSKQFLAAYGAAHAKSVGGSAPTLPDNF